MLYMNSDILRRLQKLNQLKLTDSEERDVLAFFEKQGAELESLSALDTENVERMVHVMPILTVVREDVVVKKFTREELQAGAPETMDGYWQVPRLVE
ncbi:MAG: Asp-tRNA(Asn)/Glu-tRNA(Gln) amidotransferase subunit GatC [Clostridia bacterium]|jgi:aspartyl-tRNA(Asn)/glutamyl-tRNA(Gln) amidotransferase subunit C|nr:Asp-tRNA(Asn)/Glu-tRNA(Gln) amidotransferase subunit GatC [Clostridia bacterium]